MGQQALRRMIRHEEHIQAATTNNQEVDQSRSWSTIVRRLTRRQQQNNGNCFRKPSPLENFVDLNLLPPELALEVLKNLNATDLCLASCVWSDLANDEILWEHLCRASWGFCTAYDFWKSQGKSFKRLFLLLDEACLTFNNRPEWGIKYLIDNDVLVDDVIAIARFFHSTNQLCWQKVRTYLNTRQDVFEEFIKLQSFKKQFLPNALRKFFTAVQAPTNDRESLAGLIDHFSRQFCSDNPDLKLASETASMLCFSLVLLSVDLTSPHVKNKMSKREFVRNICQATHQLEQAAYMRTPRYRRPRVQVPSTVDRDFAGHLYDNVYLIGHVAPQRWDDNVAAPHNNGGGGHGDHVVVS